jgi:hypothetical protein
MKYSTQIVFAVLALLGMNLPSHADVKNVWVGVNGATCPT